MAPPATVNSYQGQKADIMCVILGTTRKSGSGFTSKANRLNVMLSRQKSGLIVVGDITLAAFEQAQKDQQKKRANKGKGKGKGKGEPNFGGRLTYVGKDGQKQLVQAEVLRRTYWRFKPKGRVVTMAAPQEEGKKEEDEEEG